MTNNETLLKTQQGELDAVIMYQMLADYYRNRKSKILSGNLLQGSYGCGEATQTSDRLHQNIWI